MKKIIALCLVIPTLLFGATRNIVPNADNEGQIGTTNYRWTAGHFMDLYIQNGLNITNIVVGSNSISQTDIDNWNTNYTWYTTNHLSETDIAISNYAVVVSGIVNVVSGMVDSATNAMTNISLNVTAVSNTVGSSTQDMANAFTLTESDTNSMSLTGQTLYIAIRTNYAILTNANEFTNTNTIPYITGTNAVFGYGLSVNNIYSYGALQIGEQVGAAGFHIGTGSVGSIQFGKTENGGLAEIHDNAEAAYQHVYVGAGTRALIGGYAKSAGQIGYLKDATVGATNWGVGALQIFSLSNSGERAFTGTNGFASLLLGHGTATNKNSIVANGNQSHGDGSITMDSFWSGETIMISNGATASSGLFGPDTTITNGYVPLQQMNAAVSNWSYYVAKSNLLINGKDITGALSTYSTNAYFGTGVVDNLSFTNMTGGTGTFDVIHMAGNLNFNGKEGTNIASITFVTNNVVMFTGSIGGTNGVCFTCGGTNYWITFP